MAYKCSIEGDHIIFIDTAGKLPEFKIFEYALSTETTTKKQNKIKKQETRVNNLYTAWDKNKDNILKLKIKA